jgi:hypothetical protein
MASRPLRPFGHTAKPKKKKKYYTVFLSNIFCRFFLGRKAEKAAKFFCRLFLSFFFGRKGRKGRKGLQSKSTVREVVR